MTVKKLVKNVKIFLKKKKSDNMFVKVTKISQRMKRIIFLRKKYYRTIKNTLLSVVDAARLTGWAKPGEFGNLTSEFELSSHTFPHFMREKILFYVFGSFLFRECVPRPSLFDTDILKFSTRSITVNFFS